MLAAFAYAAFASSSAAVPAVEPASSLAAFFDGSDAQGTPGPAGPSATPPTSTAPTTADDIWKRLRFNADGRLRGEGTFDQLNDADRIRGRFRFRVGGEYDATPELKIGARLTTLSDGRDANNPHWDFGDGPDGFSAAEVGLDRLYMEWKAMKSVALTAGKFAHVYTRPPVTRELAWDDDIQPAGAAAVWGPKMEGAFDFDVRLIYCVAQEVNDAGGGSSADPAMAGGQVNVILKPGEKLQADVASSYSNWTNLAGFTDLGSQGNTAGDTEFGIWDSYAALTWKGMENAPIVVYAEYMENTEDDTGEDTGYAAGLQVGHTSGAGHFNAFAALYSLDANCVFSPVAQDDTPIAGTGNGTGMEGIYVGTQYFITDNLSLKLWGMTSDVDAADDPYRIRFDIDFKIK